MTDTPPISRRTLTTATAWATPAIVVAVTAPAAAASGTTAQITFLYAQFANTWGPLYRGGFDPMVTGNPDAIPVTDLTAIVTFTPDNGTYTDFISDTENGWTITQALDDGDPGVLIVTWHREPGIVPGGGNDRAGYFGFGYNLTTGTPTTSYTVTISSPTATTGTETVPEGT